jgi:ribosomal protein S18 acetylase RimI-like enzyme
MNCIVRPITEADIPEFHRVLDVVAREKKYLSFVEAPPLDSAAAFVRTNVKEDYPQFVAEADGKLVGWCDIIPAKAHTVHSHSGVLGIGIVPEFRGKGLGRKLMTATIDKARARGLTRIELSARADNKNAIELYKKLGFVIEGTKRNAVIVDGAYGDLILMSLLF